MEDRIKKISGYGRCVNHCTDTNLHYTNLHYFTLHKFTLTQILIYTTQICTHKNYIP
jgi:hypothetical protein